MASIFSQVAPSSLFFPASTSTGQSQAHQKTDLLMSSSAAEQKRSAEEYSSQSAVSSDGSRSSFSVTDFKDAENGWLNDSKLDTTGYDRPVYATLSFVGKKSAGIDPSTKTQSGYRGTDEYPAQDSWRLTTSLQKPDSKPSGLLSKLKNFRKFKQSSSTLFASNRKAGFQNGVSSPAKLAVRYLAFYQRDRPSFGQTKARSTAESASFDRQLMEIDLQNRQFSGLQKFFNTRTTDAIGADFADQKLRLHVLNALNAQIIIACCLSAASKTSKSPFHFQNPSIQSLVRCIKPLFQHLLSSKCRTSEPQSTFLSFEHNRSDVLSGLKKILKKNKRFEREKLRFDVACVYILVCVAAFRSAAAKDSQQFDRDSALLESQIWLEETEKNFRVTAPTAPHPSLISDLYLCLCKGGVRVHYNRGLANYKDSLTFPLSCDWLAVQKQCFQFDGF